jgi:hypothetical protein
VTSNDGNSIVALDSGLHGDGKDLQWRQCPDGEEFAWWIVARSTIMVLIIFLVHVNKCNFCVCVQNAMEHSETF